MTSLPVPRKWERFFWPILVSALLACVMALLRLWTATKVFPSPLDVERGMAELLQQNVLWGDIADSLRRVAIGFGGSGRSRGSAGVDARLVSGRQSGSESGDADSCGPSAPSRGFRWRSSFSAWEIDAAIFLIFLGAFFPDCGGVRGRRVERSVVYPAGRP